jgi:hypothetical protein
MATGSDGPPTLHLAHQMPGRVRLRVPRSVGPGEMAELVDRLAAVPGLTRVVGRPRTGSIIVDGSGPEGEIGRLIERHGVAHIDARPHRVAPPIDQALQVGVARLDAEIAEHTDSSLRLHSLLAILLIAVAAVQLSRGRVAGPATTLLVSALSLLERPR